MKIVHINTIQTGGAAWCAIRICKALSENGIDSRMLFAEGNSMPEGVSGAIATPDVIFWNRNLFLRIIKRSFSLFGIWLVDVEKTKKQLRKANKTNLYLHQPLSYFKNITNHPLIDWADIVHLHWVPDFIDYPTFFKTIKKPIVWTLHDKYPALGVMHYNSKFFPLPVFLKDFDEYCRKIKRDGVSNTKNLNIVAISESMINICKQSSIIGSFPVTLIHNGVDTTIFQQHNKQEARKATRLMTNTIIFLFSSYNLSDPNKGLNRAMEAIEKVDIPNKTLVCIGGNYENLQFQCSFNVIFTGMINDFFLISKYYSAADYFLLCSYEETFPQTPLESMACGTPVISTPCSGAKDVIQSFNGVICEGYDADAIAKGIKEALGKQYSANEIRQYIAKNYKYSIIAKQYIDLYKKLI